MEIRRAGHAATSLSRIRQKISEFVRQYESSGGSIPREQLLTARSTLRRISAIALETFEKLSDAIEGVLVIDRSNRGTESYLAPRVNLPALTGSFRGYPLKGRRIELPEGYVGVCLNETIRPATEKEERRFYVMGNFKSMTSWNWDKVPSKNDKMAQALDWIDVAEALHSPIAEE